MTGMEWMLLAAILTAGAVTTDKIHANRQNKRRKNAYDAEMVKQDDYKDKAAALKDRNINEALSFADSENIDNTANNLYSDYANSSPENDLSMQADSSMNATVNDEVKNIFNKERAETNSRLKSKSVMNSYAQNAFDSNLAQSSNRLDMMNIGSDARRGMNALNYDLANINSATNDLGNVLRSAATLASAGAGMQSNSTTPKDGGKTTPKQQPKGQSGGQSQGNNSGNWYDFWS